MRSRRRIAAAVAAFVLATSFTAHASADSLHESHRPCYSLGLFADTYELNKDANGHLTEASEQRLRLAIDESLVHGCVAVLVSLRLPYRIELRLRPEGPDIDADLIAENKRSWRDFYADLEASGVRMTRKGTVVGPQGPGDSWIVVTDADGLRAIANDARVIRAVAGVSAAWTRFEVGDVERKSNNAMQRPPRTRHDPCRARVAPAAAATADLGR